MGNVPIKTTNRNVPVEIDSHEATTRSMLIDFPEYDDPMVPLTNKINTPLANHKWY